MLENAAPAPPCTQVRDTASLYRRQEPQIPGQRLEGLCYLHIPSHVLVLSSSGTRGRLGSDKRVAYQADRAAMPDTSPGTELGFPPPKGQEAGCSW